MSDQARLVWTISVMAVVVLLLGVDLVNLLLSSPQPVGFQLAFYMM